MKTWKLNTRPTGHLGALLTTLFLLNIFPLFADTTSVPAYQAEVKLASQGAFTVKSPRVTDSLDYVVKLEWQDTEVPVIVLAPDSIDFPGFKVIGQATVHQKLAAGSEVKNRTEFIYKLRAELEGTGKASSMKVRYFTGLSKQEEILLVPTALIDIAKAPVRIADTLWFKLLAGVILLAGSLALAWGTYRVVLRKRKQAEPTKLDLEPEIKTLQSRLKSAAFNSSGASKEIILTMEKLAITYLEHSIHTGSKTQKQKGTDASPNSASSKTFNHTLEQYFSTHPAIAAEEKLEWEKLQDLFRHAHFAGGHKESHELQAAFRTLKRCLKLTGENENE